MPAPVAFASCLFKVVGRQRHAALRGFPDLERITARIGQGLATPRDLQGLRKGLEALPNVRRLAARWAELAAGPLPSGLQAIGEMLALALVDEVPATLKDGGLFRRGFDAELDGLHDSSHAAREWR